MNNRRSTPSGDGRGRGRTGRPAFRSDDRRSDAPRRDDFRGGSRREDGPSGRDSLRAGRDGSRDRSGSGSGSGFAGRDDRRGAGSAGRGFGSSSSSRGDDRRGSYGDDRRGSYGDDRRGSYGDDRRDRSEGRSYGDRSGSDRSSYGDRSGGRSSYGSSASGGRSSYGSGDRSGGRSSYGSSSGDRSGGRSSYGSSASGGRSSYGDRSGGRPSGERSYGDRSGRPSGERSFGGERSGGRGFGGDRSEGRSYSGGGQRGGSGRPSGGRSYDERGSRGEAPRAGRDGARSYGSGSRDGNRPSYGGGNRDGNRPSYGGGSRDGNRPSYGGGNRPSYGGSREGARPSYGRDEQAKREPWNERGDGAPVRGRYGKRDDAPESRPYQSRPPRRDNVQTIGGGSRTGSAPKDRFKTDRPKRDRDFYEPWDNDERDTTEVPDGVRLQKVLAQAGVASRRACEEMIGDGRVTVDGQVVRRFGAKVDPAKQAIHVDGKRIPTAPDLVYYALNKPIGVVSTMEDPEGRPCLADFVEELAPRLFHVGRLDTETEGLLLLTNDGELAHRLTHPSYGVQKKYWAKVPGPIPRDLGRRLKKGIELEDGIVKADSFEIVQEHAQQALVEVVLHEGRKHVVRRMLEVAGHRVIDLARIEFGPIKLGRTKPGTLRSLSLHEVGELYAAVKM
ncbi:pseudouridine synthase [Nonomuraea sp. NPDC050328]|uniref:pseudouridine synthase n=1 Tax=Nonomuraea sp. NPDC050328 TaxID=3364361 RepID=UPI00379F3462